MSTASGFSLFGHKPTQDPPEVALAASNAEAIHLDNLALEWLEGKLQAPPAIGASSGSESSKTEGAAAASIPAAPAQSAPAKSGTVARPVAERRLKRRALISAPVRVRSVDLTRDGIDDFTTTLNVSRIGILLESRNSAYYRSMDVMVTFPYSKALNALQAEQPGRVVRVSELSDGRRSVAIALGAIHRDEEIIRTSGERGSADSEVPKTAIDRDPRSVKPLVLALDAEATVRELLKSYLENEGYDVITVSTSQEARDVLNQCTPSLLIAEIEGEGMPGYDICTHCKSTPRLQRIPVILTTNSAYPSDYASAHSLGAVVCMAKPYRQERLGHVVKLLAPPANAKATSAPPRAADPSRRHLPKGDGAKTLPANVNRRFRFGR